jgi:predicted amidophosphoribosyltransferase
MKCPQCDKQYYDPPFECVNCQTELGWKCSSCQHGNPLHYRYCGRCGIPIPVGLSALLSKGEQVRVVNIPQYNEVLLTELMEERLRIMSRQKVKNLSQSLIDELFG